MKQMIDQTDWIRSLNRRKPLTKEEIVVQAMINTAKKHDDPEMMKQAERAQKELDEKNHQQNSPSK
jgi:hypothetical protein